MNKEDDRYGRLKILIESGHIKELREVFDGMVLTNVAADIGMKYQRLLYLLKRPRSIKVGDIESFAWLLKVDETKIFELIMTQKENDKKSKKKK